MPHFVCAFLFFGNGSESTNEPLVILYLMFGCCSPLRILKDNIKNEVDPKNEDDLKNKDGPRN